MIGKKAFVLATLLIFIQGGQLRASDTTQVNALLDKAKSFENVNWDSSILINKRALSLSNEISYTKGQINSYLKIGAGFIRTNKLDSAKSNYRHAFLKAQKNELHPLVGQAMYGLGVVKLRTQPVDTILAHFQGLKTYCVAHELKDTESRAWLMLGIGYRRLGNTVKSLDAYQRALSIEEELHNESMISMLLNNIAALYNDRGEIEKSLEYLLKSKDLMKGKYNTPHGGNLISNIGVGYHGIENYLLAEKYTLKAIEIRRQIGDSCGVANSLNVLANNYALQNKLDSALLMANQSDQINRLCQDSRLQSSLYISYGQIYTKLNQLNKAIFYYKKSIEISSKKNNYAEVTRAAAPLYKLLEQSGRYKEAC